MKLFKGLFSKKEKADKNKNIAISENTGFIGQAEQMANIVSTGLENENYSEMNEVLSTIVKQNDEREIYVFEHPNTAGMMAGTIIFIILSVFFAYCLFIGIFTCVFSKQYFLIGIMFIVVAILGLCINIPIIIKYISVIKYKPIYDKYNDILYYKQIGYINDISTVVSRNEEDVIKDLHKAVNLKLIPQGHFSNENLVFMISDKIYDKYSGNPAGYDRYFKQQIEERNRIKERSQEVIRMLDLGNSYVEKLYAYEVQIKDKELKRKISKMKNTVSAIFHEIDMNPSQMSSLGLFLNYYLPTTEKLLETYVNINEKKIKVSNLSKAKSEIEVAIDTIVNAYNQILEKLYEEQEMDISSEISTLEMMLKQEGLKQ